MVDFFRQKWIKIKNIDPLDFWSKTIFLLIGWWFLKPLNYGLSRGKIKQPCPVIIIGAPRSGTTIIYQAISNWFNLTYLNNLTHLLHPYPHLAFRLSQFLFGFKAHNTYQSYFGRTHTYGLHAPSESGGFWKRSLNMPEKNPLSGVNTPYFLAKNTFLSLRLQELKAIWPHCKIIFIKRDPFQTCQSILNARKKLFHDEKQWFSVKPENWKSWLNTSPSEQIVNQVHSILTEIHVAKTHFSPQQWLEINYADFCNETDHYKEKIRDFINPKLTDRSGIIPLEIKNHNRKTKDDVTFTELKALIEKFNWTFE